MHPDYEAAWLRYRLHLGDDFHGGPEFVYLLRWPGDEVRAKAWKAFLADPDWVAIKKSTAAKYGDLVEDVQDRQLQLTPYTRAPSTVP